MLIANGVYPYGNGFTRRKHNDNGNSVIDYVLVSEDVLDCIHKFSLGEWTSEYDNRSLSISLKCIHRFDYETQAIEDNKQSHMSMNFKCVPIYSKKLVSLKTSDLQRIKTEILKWTGMDAQAWINDMFNDAL